MMTVVLALALCMALLVAPGLALADSAAAGTAAPTRTPKPTTAPRETATPRPQTITDDAPTFNSLGDAVNPSSAQDITKSCTIKVTEGKVAPMLDGKIGSAWSNKKAKAKINITLPKTDNAGGLYIEWAKKPGDFSLIEYDGTGAEIANSGRNISYVGFVNYYSLTEATKKVVISFAKKGNAIASLRVYGAGNLPSAVQNFGLPARKAELMVVVAHPGEEFLYMGGTIPYYSVGMGRQVQVVYMGNPGRAGIKEALTGLWAVGHKNYPDFLGFSNKSAKTQKAATKLWNSNKVREALVDRIRHYKPEVIVANDSKGEGGDGTAMLLAKLMQEAVEQAADATKYKKSADKYGAWQVKKLYLHLENENQISMNWTDAIPELGDRSPSEMARVGYASYKALSRSKNYVEAGKNDNALFGLVMTKVGEDVRKNDMMENIPMADEDDSEFSLNEPDDEDIEADFPDVGQGGEDDWEGDWPDEDSDSDDSSDAALPANASVNLPTDTAPKNPPDARLIAMLVGVPVLLGGGVFGFGYGQKYVKKLRRQRRRTQRQQDDPPKTEDV